MSMLKETVAQVIQGNNLVLGNAWDSTFKHYEALNGSSVITGALVPRDNGSSYLLLDNLTGEPLQVPPNIVPWQIYFYPTIPLESNDLSAANIDFLFYDDTSFTNSYNPWQGGAPNTLHGDELNSGAFLQLDDGGYMSDFIGYPYLGGTVNNNSFTAGVLQVYIYYYSAYTPPLP